MSFAHRPGPGGIRKRRFSDDRKPQRGGNRDNRRPAGRPDNRRKPDNKRRPDNKKDRLPKDDAKAKEMLDNALMKFQQSRGINVEKYEAIQKEKLDAQLKQFQEKRAEQAQ